MFSLIARRASPRELKRGPRRCGGGGPRVTLSLMERMRAWSAARERRSNPRRRCRLRVEVLHGAAEGWRIGAGELLDLSLTGARVRLRPEMRRGEAYRVRLELEDGPLDLTCRVARPAPPGPEAPGERCYGLELNLTSQHEQRLRGLLAAMGGTVP